MQKLKKTVVCVDVGFGETKALSPDKNPVRFPSVIGPAVEYRLGSIAPRIEQDGRVRVWKDGVLLDRLVGHDAVTQTADGWATLSRDRSAEDMLLLHGAAFYKLGVEGRVVLVSGTPVSHYPAKESAERVEWQRNLEGSWRVNDADIIVENAVPLPQPAGTAYYQGLTTSGAFREPLVFRGKVGIIDIGQFTTDCIVLDQSVYVEQRAFTVEAGVSNIRRAIAVHLSKVARWDGPQYELEQPLREGFVTVAGHRFDLTEVIEQARNDTGMRLQSRLTTEWRNIIGLDLVYLSGGGAYYFEDIIKQLYPDLVVVKEPEMANVRGYLAFANFNAQLLGV